MTCAVGGIASVSASGELRVLVEDVVELALEHVELRPGQAEAGEVGDVLDIGTGELGHAGMIAGRAGRADTGAAHRAKPDP